MDDNKEKEIEIEEYSEEPKIENDLEPDQKQNCCLEMQEVKNRCLYLTAEFDNYKKRIEKEKARWIEDGQDMILKNLLSIIDDFHRAFKKLQEQDLPQEALAHFQGINLIAKELDKFLTNFQVTEIKYDNFDPEIHEALIQVETDKHKSGHIVDVLEKGYMRKGILLRPAKVSVAK